MKRAFFLILFLIFVGSIYSQNISVSSFKLLATDLTANTSGTMEQDQNGETAALIKVVTTQTGFSFDGGAMGIVKTVLKPSEIWVYVPRGLKKITISHPQLGILRDYYFNIPIDAARTYEMKLVTGEVRTIVQEGNYSQYLVIQVTPTDAIVEVNNELIPVSDGIAQKFLKFGTYDYRVLAKNYHTSAGKVTIDNPNEKKVLSIDLTPAFGWIETADNEEWDGALVYVDNSFIGKTPIKSTVLSSGKHIIKVAHPLYHAYEEVINVQDNETTIIKPAMVPDFSNVNIKTENDVAIYVNDEYKGNGSWTGKLGSGSYLFEARKANHRSTKKNQDITSSQKEYYIQLEKPNPITGNINITSNPLLSDVYIDGKSYGQTPLYLPEFLVGNHKLVVKHQGYGDYSSVIKVEENKLFDIEAILKNTVTVSFACNHPNANLYIDGNYVGDATCTRELEVGEHRIEVKSNSSDNYAEYVKYVTVSGSNNHIDINLEPKYINVYFTSDKEDAYVIIDEKASLTNLSMKPVKAQFKTGVHELRFSLNGKKSISRRVEFKSSQNFFHVSFKDREIYVR
jgi:hypothetical protein